MNLLIIHDDIGYLDYLLKIVRKKGVKIVEFPSLYDIESIIPFFIMNDNSIIVFKNPKKDILPILN